MSGNWLRRLWEPWTAGGEDEISVGFKGRCRIDIIITITMGCTQIPISTFSHIWVFVRLYGIMFVIIVIAIIITIIIKSEGVNAQL